MLGSLRLYDRAPGSPGHFVGVLFDQILSDKARGLAVPPIGLSAVFFHATHLDEDTGLRVTDAIDYIESIDLVYDPGAAGYVREALAALSPKHLLPGRQSHTSRRSRNARRTRSHHAARSNPIGPGPGPHAGARARHPVGTRCPISTLEAQLTRLTQAMTGLAENRTIPSVESPSAPSGPRSTRSPPPSNLCLTASDRPTASPLFPASASSTPSSPATTR